MCRRSTAQSWTKHCASCLHNPGLSQACTIRQILANLRGEKSFKFFHCRLAQRYEGSQGTVSASKLGETVKHVKHVFPFKHNVFGYLKDRGLSFAPQQSPHHSWQSSSHCYQQWPHKVQRPAPTLNVHYRGIPCNKYSCLHTPRAADYY